MSDSNSTAPPGGGKPAKPYPDFPLFPHASRRWAKKIRGRQHYFGPWSDPDGALAKYLEQKDALHAGRRPRESAEGVTIKDLANAYLNLKQARLDAGELSPLTMLNCKEACATVVAAFGKQRLAGDLGPDDFAALRADMTGCWGAVRVRDMVQRIRSVFKFGLDIGLLDRAARFGPGFARPLKKVIRLERARQGAKLFTAEEIRRMIDAAGVPLKAMLLLAINGGFGNADCGRLPLSALDLGRGWIDFPRPKTGIPRRCPLWPETVAALKEVLAKRKEPKDPAAAGLAFVTKYGDGWAKDTMDNPITKEAKKLLNKLGITGRKGLGFYTLRHVFRTIADESKDQPAVDHIMGHESTHMSSVYRETISDARLRAVVDHVRAWLFPRAEKPTAVVGGE